MPSRARPERGWFLTLEGPEGSGKTTQAARLHAAIEAAGPEALLLREPGGSALGEAIRGLLLAVRGSGAAAIDPRADALLFNAARAQLVAEQVRPALARGAVVICGRFSDSTLAYQGYGMGLPLDDLRALARFATGGLTPDLTVLLDLPAEVGLARKAGEETRFEADYDLAFHGRVRDGFRALAAAEPERFVTVDASAAPDAVFAALLAAVRDRLGSALGDPEPRERPGEPNHARVRITS